MIEHGRDEHEREVGEKIENIVACEGMHRIERLESQAQWSMRPGFLAPPINDEVVAASREMLGHYMVGWG